MKNLFLIAFSAFLIPAALFAGEPEKDQPQKYKYDYEVVKDDPLGAMIYTLDNGLKVYMSINRDEPRIQTQIAVRTGSKQDPRDATGLAHYLEHMLFKGTSNMGTIDWEKEKALLQQISDLYEKHRNTRDEEERKKIYGEIDRLSSEAAKFAVANEYDKMVASLGAKNTNAFTSLEQTVYINDIPANEIEKWMKLESERFSQLVLRLFHTELEAVYEEFNRAQDSDRRLAYYTLMKNLFPTHPYGTQTTIGTGEHLKNPSMEKIHAYFNARYAPNNMAIVLSGDIDPDKTVDLVKKYFGDYQKREVSAFHSPEEEPIKAPVIKKVAGRDAAFMMMGFRMDGAGSRDAMMGQLLDGILNNGQAGLIDLNLVQKQKVLRARSSFNINEDYSMFIISANPREGQSLEGVQGLLLEQLNLVKAGKFDDWMMKAVVNNLRLREIQISESNWGRAMKMTSTFITGEPWMHEVNKYNKMEKITKEQFVAWANERLKDNYVSVHKETGEPNNYKVEKPAITPIDISRDTKSSFYKEFENMPSERLKPLYLDYEAAIENRKMNSGIPFSYIRNESNELFELYYILDMGSDNDKKMALAIKYLPYLGTSKYSPEELQKEFFKLGVSFDVFTSRDRIYVTMNGLESSFEGGLKLFEEVLADVKADPNAYTDMVEGILKERTDAKLNKNRILYRGLLNYAQYGEDAPNKNIYSEKELRAMDPNSLTEKVQELSSYEHRIFYFGKNDPAEVMATLDKHHKTAKNRKPYPKAKEFKQLPTEKNKVLFVNYDMVQTEMMMISKSKTFDKSLMAESSIFNEYFGAGLSSIVFQEIRESKALAYSAYCFYSNPSKKEDAHYVRAYIGTQADKLPDASKAMLDLMNDIPEAKIQFEDAKLAALKKIETERITKTSVFWNYESAKRRGLDYDIRKEIYGEIENMDFAKLKSFFDENIKGQTYTFLVIGNKENLDMETLKALGEFKEVTLEELFGY